MSKLKLDIFDLKRLQLNKSKQELMTAGQERQAAVSSQQLATFIPVVRDPVAAI